MFSVFLGVALLIFAGYLLYRHVSLWRQQQSDFADPQLDYFRRQFRRRMLASSLLAVVGAALVFSRWIADPWVALAYWSSVVVVLVSIVLLAVADVSSTSRQLQDLHIEHLLERARLEKEIERLKQNDSNGKPT